MGSDMIHVATKLGKPWSWENHEMGKFWDNAYADVRWHIDMLYMNLGMKIDQCILLKMGEMVILGLDNVSLSVKYIT